MQHYQHLFVVIDPDLEKQIALARAVELAAKTGAEITVFLCIYDLSYELTTMLSLDERDAMRKAVLADRNEWLQSLIAEYVPSDISAHAKVVWDKSLYESAIRTVLAVDADLLIKAASSHDDFASLIFTPTDWHILRKCPTPVLMVKQHAWPANGNILASINVGTEDEVHAELNQHVVECAKACADTLDATLHLVNAFPGTIVNLAIEMPEFDPHGYNENVKRHHQNEMHKFATANAVPLVQCHVIQGLPEVAVPKQANSLDAELVVIGTVGRAGLSAALIGNTAEQVIDRLNCDVLAIKPAGFHSPVHG